MSVRIGTRSRVSAFTAARIRRPSSRPGPRNDRIDVRFALSYDALKTNGTPARRVISTSRPARSRVCASLSITQGPAMSTNGIPPPTASRSPTLIAVCRTGLTPPIVSTDRRRRGARLGLPRLVRVGAGDERGEERMRARRLRFELRMELHREIPRVARQLGDLDELAVGRASGDLQAVFGERALVEAVELVAVPMPLVDERRAVHALRERSGRQLAGVAPEPHGAAEVVDAQQIAQLVDHLRARVGVALGGIGVGEAGDVARVLDRRPLEPVADAEVRNLPLARRLRGEHHAARAAVAEAARHENAVRAVEQRTAVRLLERLGLDPLDVHLQAMREAAVVERLVQALVGILVADVLADDMDRDLVLRILDPVDEILPRVHPPLGLRQVEVLQHDLIEPFA